MQWPSTLSPDCSKRHLSQGTLMSWISCSQPNVVTLDDLAEAASSLRGLMTALAPAFRDVDSIVGLNFNYLKNGDGFSTVVRYVNPCGISYQRMVRSTVRCKLSGTPNTLEPCSAQMVTFIVRRYPGNNHLTRDENQCVCQKSG